MVIALTPQQFKQKLQALHTRSPKLVENGDAGMLSNSDITLSYTYDGIASLTITVLQKHSLKAKLAPESLIEKSISGIFATL